MKYGFWCAYVGIRKPHILHSLRHDKTTAIVELDVHGGVNYSADYVNEEDKDDESNTWWFGFSCAQPGDRIPCDPATKDLIYRDVSYVQAECTRLAQQLSTFRIEDAS